MKRKSVVVAYLLWFIGSFGMMGLHRFYIHRNVSGLIWLLSFGVLGFGAYIDFFTLWKKVAEYNLEARVKHLELLHSLNRISY